MSPEMQAEHARREQRKGFTTAMAANAMQSLLQDKPDMPAAELAKRAWDIAEEMAVARHLRGHEPG